MYRTLFFDEQVHHPLCRCGKIPEPLLSRNSLNETATTCVRFMEGLCNDHHIQLTLQCAPDVGDVNLDTSLFEQVLVNIIKKCCRKHRPGRRNQNHHHRSCIARSSRQRSGHQQGNGRKTIQSLLFNQATRARHRTYLYPRSAESPWMYILTAYLQRWLDLFPNFISIRNGSIVGYVGHQIPI